MSDQVVVFGGSGFLGKHVVNALVRSGRRVRIAVRRPHVAAGQVPNYRPGQVQIVAANVRDKASVARAMAGMDGVVNLVGVLSERGRQRFHSVHVDGARLIAETAAAMGVNRLVHVSAIGADPKSRSAYGRSKGQGEAAVRAALPGAVILRPSIVFGPEDDFFNRFGAMAALAIAPGLPLIGGGRTRFQPIFVGDVAEAVVAGLERGDARGRTYELGGPTVYSFRELLEFTLAQTVRRKPLLPLPFFLAGPLGAGFGLLGRLLPVFTPPLTADQVKLLKRDNVVGQSGEAGIGAARDLCIGPLETIEAITPTYLWRFRPYGQFTNPTQAAG